jgi:hypothetical protein
MSGGNLNDAKDVIGQNGFSITDRYSHLTAPDKTFPEDRGSSKPPRDLCNP